MKRILLLLLTSILLYATPVKVQQDRLNAELWKQEKLFGVDGFWVDAKVVHFKDMHEKGAWGDVYFDDSGSHIEVLNTDEMPPQMKEADKVTFQNKILQHEVMHVLMTSKNVPDEWQDNLIHIFQPYIKKAK